LNILYDGPFTQYPKGGVLRYYRELSLFLLNENEVYFSRYSNKDHSKDFILPPFAHFRPHKISFYFEYLWFKYSFKNKIDIVHPIEFQLSPAGSYFVSKGAKLVITIHDLIHERFGAPAGLYDRKSRYDFYKKADGYLFVSESTQNDFGEFYPDLFTNKPSKVIWHGSNYSVRNDTANKSSKTFLFVGSRRGYKNFSTAAKAFCEIAKNDPKARLVIAGAPPYQDELELLKDVQNQIDWKVFPQDNELIDLYSSSLALLYTSNYEGFGMPMVEAMSQGCIPIAGNHSSVPEVLGDAGLKVNTHSVSEVASAMYKCMTDAKFVENLQKKGFNRISKFDWYSTARKILKFYKSL
jgi:mannosyltransferase